MATSLDAYKPDRYDGISVRMLKLTSPSIMKPHAIIFQNCLSPGNFPDDWKKGNIVPVHTKNSIQNCLSAGTLPDDWKRERLFQLTKK